VAAIHAKVNQDLEDRRSAFARKRAQLLEGSSGASSAYQLGLLRLIGEEYRERGQLLLDSWQEVLGAQDLVFSEQVAESIRKELAEAFGQKSTDLLAMAQSPSQRYNPTKDQIEEQRRTAQQRIEANIGYAAITPARGATGMPPRIDSRTQTVYNLAGTNNRINIGSEDSSTNVVNVTPHELFRELREAFQEQVGDAQERERILARLDALEHEHNAPSAFQRYVDFMAAAANHATIIGPYLPALAQLIHPS